MQTNLQGFQGVKKEKQYLALEASAGSGKTFALTVRYLSLLFSGVNPNEILTLTFTKKATGEMRERIAGSLAVLASINGNYAHGFAKNILDALCKDYGFKEEEIIPKARDIYQNFILQNPQIKTIDSFLAFIARKFCWYIGISSKYETRDLDYEKINESFLGNLPDAIYQKLLNQCETERDISGFILLIGLEDKITAKLRDFLKKNLSIEDSENLDLEKINERILLEIKQIKEEMLSSIQKMYLKVENDENANKSAKKIMKDLACLQDNIDEILKKPVWRKTTEHRDFKKLDLQLEFEEIHKLMNRYLNFAEAAEFMVIKSICKDYERALDAYYRKENILNFGDVEKKVYQLLGELSDSDFFYFRLDSRFSHILVDEFQDTSFRQYEILKPLMDEIRSGNGVKDFRSLFFVGDPKQSIYQFRGADSSVFEKISAFTTKENLPYNYRSSEVVVEFNNQYFSKVFKDAYYPQSLPSSSVGSGGYVKVYEIQNEEDRKQYSKGEMEFFYVAQSLETLFENNIPQEKITILCYDGQTIQELKEYLHTYFAQKNQEVSIVGDSNKKLSSMTEVKTLSTCLQYIYAENTKDKRYYEKCVLKMMGKGFQDTLVWLEKRENLSECLWYLMRELKLCDDFAKSMLEISFKHYDLEEFLKELERTGLTQDKEVALEGVRIMTIHASKGLEFDHVIWCDRVKPIKNTERLLDDGERVFSKSVKDIHELRCCLDDDYRNVSQECEKKALLARKNVLYVAFTRAKYSLFVIPSYSFRNEEIPLPEAIEIGKIRKSGNPENQVTRQKIDPIVSKDYGLQDKNDYVIENHNVANQSTIFGEALHLCMEHCWLLENDELRNKVNNRYGFYLEDGQIEKILIRKDQFKNVWREFLIHKDRSHCVYSSEISIFWDENLYRLDSIARDEVSERMLILDYKSGRELDEHKVQLTNYVSVMKKIFPDSGIQGMIAYVWDDPKLVTIEYNS